MHTVTDFRGDYRFLSNIYPSMIRYEGVDYPTVEHAFQASKTLDLDMRRSIAKYPSPGSAKRAGRKLLLRPDWDDVRDEIMRYLLRLKFEQRDLKLRLMSTGDAVLIEGNEWHDNYWGRCSCSECRASAIGQNKLGHLLMQIRRSLA